MDNKCLVTTTVLSLVCVASSALCQHDLVDKVDDGRSRLLGVQFCEKVAHVLCHAAGFLGNKTKHLNSGVVGVSPPSVLWVDTAEGNTVHRVMSPEENSPLAIGQRDAL